MRYAVLLLTLLPTATYAGNSLCGPDERIIFSCAVGKSGKSVSLCASKKLEKNNGYLQYRYGKTTKIELIFPSDKAGSLSKFNYSHYFRYQLDLNSVSFSNGGFQYSIFSNFSGEEGMPDLQQGVSVSDENRSDFVQEFICNKDAVNNLMELEGILPCDAESNSPSCSN